MDGIGTIVFLIIAAILSGLSSKAQKKAKEGNMQKKQVAPTATKPEDPFEEMLKKFVGETSIPQPIPYENVEEENVEFDSEVQMDPQFQEVDLPEPAPVSVEYEVPAEPVKEERLYPPTAYPPIDFVESIEEYDYSSSLESIEEFNYDLMNVDNYELSTKPIDQNENVSTEQKSSLVDDFDPVKAIIFSEIITPKYI